MENKTESYITLKPIAERFSRIANEITDKEIDVLIKEEMRSQLRKVDFKEAIQEIVDDYMEEPDNVENIVKMLGNSIKERFR